MSHEGVASGDEAQPLWHDVAVAAAGEARRRSSVTAPNALRLIDDLFRALISEYDNGIHLATSSGSSEEFASAWSRFLRQNGFELNYIATLKALAEYDADAITCRALDIQFSTEALDPFVKEALADLTARVSSLIVSSCLRSSASLQRSTILAILTRAISAPRNCAAYAHSWARTIGVVSICHLDLVLDAFRSELLQSEVKAAFSPEVAGIFSMLTYIRVVVASSLDAEKFDRIHKVLEFHRHIFLTKSYKHPVPAVVLAHLTVLDIHVRQWSSILPKSEMLDFLFRTCDSLSKLPLCKAASLALMSSLLERWPECEWRQKNIETFLNKRVLRHVMIPRKTAHCLRIILRLLRGKYQPRVHLNCVDGDGLSDSIAVHPEGSSPRFHPYAFRMRDFSPETDSDGAHIQLQRFAKVIQNRKLVHMAWPGYKWEIVEIVMQLAAHDAVWTLNHIVIPLLAWKKTNNQAELLLALEVIRKIFNEFGDFHCHALDDTKRETLWGTLALSVTSSLESILGRMLFELGLSSSSERALVALHITSASEDSNEYSLFFDSSDNQSNAADAVEDDSDLEDSEGSDYVLSPIKRRPAPRTTSTYTLRLGSSEFPFLETHAHAQSSDHNGDYIRASFSPSRVNVSEMREVIVSTTIPAESRSSDALTRSRSGELSVFIAAVRCLAVLPSLNAISDTQCSFFMLPMLLHQSPSIALAVSHSLQEIAANKDSSWFFLVTNSLITFLSDIPLHEHVSITTLIRQIIANIDFWSIRNVARNVELPENCIEALLSLDSVALTYIGHQTYMVRVAAFQLAQCVRQCLLRLGVDSRWNLASWLSEKNLSIVLSAQACLSDYTKVSYPGGIFRNESSSSKASGSLLCKSSSEGTRRQDPSAQFSGKGSFRDLITSDSADSSDLISASLIVLIKLLNGIDESSKMRSLLREMVLSRLTSLLAHSIEIIGSMSITLSFLLSIALSLKPKSELDANNLMLSLLHFMLVSNKDMSLQKSIEFIFAYADAEHLALLITTLNQSRNGVFSNISANPVVSSKKNSRRRGELQEQPERTDRADIDCIWSRFLISLSEPKRLRFAFQSSPRVRVLYLEICRFGITKSFRKWCRTPDHLSDRVQFLGNVCFALRRRHKYDGVDLSGPFLESDIPEWTRDDRSRTLAELRSWSECGEVSSPSSEELYSLLRSRWSVSVELQVQTMQSAGGKPLSDRDRATFTLELQNRMEDQFSSSLADLRLRSFWCISRIFSLGSVLEDSAIAEENWLDWALQAEVKGVPVLQMMICFHWKEMPKLLDRLYWETSEDGPLAPNLFAACASQLVPVCFGLSAYMTRNELEDSVPLSDDDLVSQNLKRPLINNMLAPLIVCAIFHMGSHSRRISQTAAAMLARLCDILFTKNLSQDQVKSLSILRAHHPGLQSTILSIRCKNALIISRTVANLCAPELTASILSEAVLRWAQFHNSQWRQKQWFIDSFEPFFLALPFHRYSAVHRSESARLMLSDMVNVTRSLVRDDAPALQSMLSIWQCFAGGRSEENRLTNVHTIAAFILDENVAVVEDDYIRAASLIAVELYRHSPLAVLDCILHHFEQLDVSLKGRSDPVSQLRIPAALLSSVLGARFQSCRARLSSILHHTFLWITIPNSPCIRVLHDILHYSNVIRVPTPLTTTEGSSTSLSGLIQPIPSLDRMSFQWNGDDCREWDVSDDSKILSVFQRVARCASAIYDAEFVIPIEFICKVVKRWISRAFGDNIVSDWASAAFHTAIHSPRTDLVLFSLRLLSILSVPNALQSYLSLGGILSSAVSRLEHRSRAHHTTFSVDEAIILQVIQIFSNGVNCQCDFVYDQFRIIIFTIFQTALLCHASPSLSILKSSLALLQSCLKLSPFLKVIQLFPKELSGSENSQEFTPLRFAFDICNIGKSLSGFGYNGLQSTVIDTMMMHSDSGDVLTLALSASISLWNIPCDEIVDSFPARRSSFVVSMLPWMLFQARCGSNLALAQQFATRLASAIEESECKVQFSGFTETLRVYACEEGDPAKVVDLMASQLINICFPHDAEACCQALLYVARYGPTSLFSASFYVGAQLLKQSDSDGTSYLNAFNGLLRFALKSVSTQYCDDLSIFLQSALVAGRSWFPSDACSDACFSDEGDPDRKHCQGDDKYAAGTALACLSADPTAFFACDSPYALQFMPGCGEVEGRKLQSPIHSKSRFEARRESFQSKNLASPGSSRNHDQSRKSSINVIPVPCTLANLVDTPHLADHFRKFVSVHGDVRNFDFYRAVTSKLSNSLSADPHSIDFTKAATLIVDRFLRGSAHTQIDIDSSIKNEIVEQLESNPGPNLFHKALQLVKTELMTSYTAFCDSSDYDRLVRSGQLVSP